jgi:hypothetical protein
MTDVAEQSVSKGAKYMHLHKTLIFISKPAQLFYQQKIIGQ